MSYKNVCHTVEEYLRVYKDKDVDILNCVTYVGKTKQYALILPSISQINIRTALENGLFIICLGNDIRNTNYTASELTNKHIKISGRHPTIRYVGAKHYNEDDIECYYSLTEQVRYAKLIQGTDLAQVISVILSTTNTKLKDIIVVDVITNLKWQLRACNTRNANK